MANTVTQAFREFLRDQVNLDPVRVERARSSRGWLFDQIHRFPQNYSDFPILYPDQDIAYGSFSRGTKIRPLDDVDLISCMHATGGSYLEGSDGMVEITVPQNSRLYQFRDVNTSKLNSRKVINIYIAALENVAQYTNAEVNRRSEGAVLNLSSYEWSFDIIPSFFTVPDQDGRNFYLIPDGQGNWKKTDPRIDRDWVRAVDARHSDNMLSVLRLMKYWNNRATAPAMPSYLLECITVRYFSQITDRTCSEFPDIEISRLLRDLSSQILLQVPDPKGIQRNINELDYSTTSAISKRALYDAQRADEAVRLEEHSYRASINKWAEIFGPDFPRYG